MNFKNPLLLKLSQYGVNAAQLSPRQIQEKIIQMYDQLQQTTTQNLLLRKQNDDLSLQIKTIQEVFTDAKNNPKQGLSPRTYQQVHTQDFFDNRQEKTNFLRHNQTSSKSKQNIPQPLHYQNSKQIKPNNQRYLEESKNSQQKSIETEQKTPRNSSKPNRNSRFCSDPQVLDKQPTSRMVSGENINGGKQNSLNEKIQILMKQNEIILKRMNQIEVNFIKKSQPEQEKFKFNKNIDDRSTHFSSNITSIQKMWGKKDYQSHSRGLSSNNRAYYSTSNLKSYCPSIE